MPTTRRRTGGRLGRVLAADSPLLWWYGFPVAFALTCVIEVPAYLAAFTALGWSRGADPTPRGLGRRRAVALAMAVNLVTHPVLWALVLRWPGLVELVAAEGGVVIVEGLVIFAVMVRSGVEDTRNGCLIWSIITAVAVNALSVLVGAALLPVLTGR